MAGLRFLAGASLNGFSWHSGARSAVICGAIGWIAASFACYLYNGTSDLVEDRLNGSTRPMARGALPATLGRRISLSAAIFSLLLVTVAHPAVMLPVAALLFLAYGYGAPSMGLKRSVAGVFLSGFGVGALGYTAGLLAAGPNWPSAPALLFVIVMSLWTGLVGQTKDLPDLAGDRAAGRRTLPVILGDARARCLLGAVALVLGFGYLLMVMLSAPGLRFSALITAAGASGVAAALWLARHDTDRYRRRGAYRIFMVTQYAAAITIIVA